MAWNNPTMYHKWILNPYTVKRQQQYYRLLSHGFIHADYGHLFFNGFALYIFGNPVLQIFQGVLGEVLGMIGFIVLFCLGVVLAALPSFWRYADLPHYNSLGASGGVATILFVFIAFSPLSDLSFMFIPVTFDSFILGIGYLAYSYYKDQQGGDNVNHNAHFIGAIFGVVVAGAMIVLIPEAKALFEILWQQETFDVVGIR